MIVADTTRAQAGRAVAELAPATQRTRARHVASSAVVVVFNDSTLALQETPAAAPIPLAVPPPVVERIRAADAFAAQLERENGALRELVRADTAAIDTRDTKMELLTPRRRRCGTTCKTVIVVAALAAGREVAKRTGFRITVSRG